MTTIWSLVAWTIAVPVTVVIAVFVLETLCGLVALPIDRDATEGATADIAVIVPAHDEALGIGRSLAALLAVLPARARIVVVADNCSDDTAAIARASGVEVVERKDPDRRGKGYALAFARDVLAAAPPEVVIVVDADCVLAAGSLELLGRAAKSTDRPAQAVYLMRPSTNAAPMVQISSFAFLVKNLVRQRGAARLADVGILGGTGMALPWALFVEAPLASDDIVEDLSLGIWATERGHPPRLVEAARVESDPAVKDATLGQRARWEHGFLHTARARAAPLVIKGLARADRAMLWLGLHLCVPPLALLMLLTLVALAALAGLVALGAMAMPLVVLAVAALLAGLAVVLAWLAEGRATLSIGALLQAPLYVLWKLPVYLGLLNGRKVGWERTRRPGEGSHGPTA